MSSTIISDINEAVSVIETYNLAGLIWEFKSCPLEELKHYIPKGREELVVVARKDNGYLSNRLVNTSDPIGTDPDDYKITLNFYNDYHLHIILSPYSKPMTINIL